jgi:polysaccharide export outer membrane protein
MMSTRTSHFASLTRLVWFGFVAAPMLFGCEPKGSYVWASAVAPTNHAASKIVRPGDKLLIVVQGQEAMSGEVEVKPGGEFVMPVAGRFRAVGLTPEGLAAELTKRLQGVLARPSVTVVLTSRKTPNVSIIGEVKTPGRYEIREGDGVLEALARAGGLTTFADEDAVFVVRRAQQAPRVRFRYADLAAGSPASINFELIDGDIVVVE